MKMQSPSKHFYSLWQRLGFLHLNSCRHECSSYTNGVNHLMQAAFCTVIEPVKANESPHIPSLVAYSAKNVGSYNKEGEDFVPPWVSDWIETHRIRDEDIDVKTVVPETVESNIDEVSRILKSRFESPDLVVQALEGCDVDVSDSLVAYSAKNVGSYNKEGEDFVPPWVSDWIETHRIRDEDIDVKTVVPETVESNIDKVSRILKSWFESPDLVVQALEGCDDVPDSLVEQVLRRFSCDWKPGFGFFKWSELRKGGKHSPELYNLMIDNLGKVREFETLWELVEDMKNLEGYITLDTMTKIMRRLAKASKHKDAIQTFEMLESFGLEKDALAMNILMDAFSKEGSIEHSEKVFSMYNKSIHPTLHTYNILVHGRCKIGQIDKAKTIISDMKLHGLQPDTITYTHFIEAYCREKDFRRVEATLKEMRENGCDPNVVTYTIMMNALAKANKIDKAVEVYEVMKANNCKPDAPFYTVFIKALNIAGRIKDADAVFEDMLKQGIVPDVWTYNALISIAAHDFQEEKALKLLKKMEESRCKPDLNTYAPLLKMCCIINRMKLLSFLVSHMFKNDVSIDLGTYTLLINRLCKKQKLELACFYFKELLDKGFVPEDCTYDTLIKELKMKGMHEAKREIEELFLSKNFGRITTGKESIKKSKSKNL